MPLTPEEKEELKQLRVMESEEELNQVQVGSESLSPEEQSELAGLRKLEEDSSKVSSLESVARGAGQGLSLGFADEISGGIESALTDKPYEQAVKESRENFEKASVANPNSYLFGEIAGGVGGFAATAGAGTLVGVTTAGYRGAAIVGGLSGVGFSNRKGSDLIKDAAIGVAFGSLGEVAAKGIGRLTQKMFQKSSTPVKEVFTQLGETTTPENVKWESKLIRDAFAGRYNTADEFIMSNKFGQHAQGMLDETPDLMKDILHNKRKGVGTQISSVVDDLPVQSVDVNDLIETFNSGLKENLRATGTDKAASRMIKSEILDALDKGALGAKGSDILNYSQLTPLQAIEVKRALQDILFKKTAKDGTPNFIKDSLAAKKLLNDFSDSLIDRTNKLDPSGNLEVLNGQYKLLMDAIDLVPERSKATSLLRLQNPVDGTIEGSNMRLLQQTLEGIDPEFHAMMIKEINPRLTLTRMHNAAQFGGGSIAQLFRAKAAAGLGEEAGGAIGKVAGGVLSFGDAALVNSANLIAKARKAFKVPRSVQGVLENADIITSKLSTFLPSLSIAFNDIVASGDENAVEQFMIELMQNPKAQEQFEDGLGFNGKAVTEEEVESVRNQIMASPFPLFEKVQAIQELESSGTIPVPPRELPVLELKPEVIQKKVATENLNLVRRTEKELGE